MEEEVVRIQTIFSGVLPRFNYTHAKVYAALVGGPAKEGKQLVIESGLSKSNTYKVLGELIEFGLIKKLEGETPTYHNHKPIAIYNCFAKKQIKALEENKAILKQIANGKTTAKTQYVIEEDGNGKKQVLDTATKRVIKERNEIKKLQTILHEIEKQLPMEKSKWIAEPFK